MNCRGNRGKHHWQQLYVQAISLQMIYRLLEVRSLGCLASEPEKIYGAGTRVCVAGPVT
jgi:hypothetical protein